MQDDRDLEDVIKDFEQFKLEQDKNKKKEELAKVFDLMDEDEDKGG
jgi:hypothetical protein